MGSTNFQSVPNMQNGMKVGSGTQITKILKGQVSVNLPSIADADVGEATATLTGAVAGDVIMLCAPAAGLTAGLAICDVRVSAADEIKVRAVNGSGGAIDEAATTFDYVIIRS